MEFIFFLANFWFIICFCFSPYDYFSIFKKLQNIYSCTPQTSYEVMFNSVTNTLFIIFLVSCLLSKFARVITMHLGIYLKACSSLMLLYFLNVLLYLFSLCQGILKSDDLFFYFLIEVIKECVIIYPWG